MGPGSGLGAWQEAGVDRLLVASWPRSRDAVEGLARLVAALGLAPGGDGPDDTAP